MKTQMQQNIQDILRFIYIEKQAVVHIQETVALLKYYS